MLSKKDLTLIYYLYLASLIFLPLDFFVFSEQNNYGTTLSVSKVLQISTYFLIMINILIFRDFSFIEKILLSLKKHKYFFYFIGIVLLSTTIGFINRNYNAPIENEFNKLFFLEKRYLLSLIRPVYEIGIEFHKYFYFILLAPIILDTKEKIHKFFKVLFIVIIINLFISFCDYGLTFLDLEMIPRHLIDWRHVGYRLHGLFGEPRDAYIGLIFSICFISIYKQYINKKMSYFWIPLFIGALFFTNATSGALGSIICIFIMGIQTFVPASFASNSKVRIFIFINIVVVILFFLFSLRFQFYFFQILQFILNILESKKVFDNIDGLKIYILDIENYLKTLWEIDIRYHVKVGEIIPSGRSRSGWGLTAQSEDFIALLAIMERFLTLDIWNIFIGSGSGSISFYNNKILGVVNVVNSHSKFINILFNYGLIGIFSLIYSMQYVIKNSFSKCNIFEKQLQLGVFYWLVCSNFIHDSYLIYLIVGLILSCNLIRRKLD